MAKTKTTKRAIVVSDARKPKKAPLVAQPLTGGLPFVPPTVEPGQRGVTIPPFFFRYLPSWNTPTWFESKRWRQLVRNQPIAMICKGALQDTIAAMDWAIVPRDTSQLSSLKKSIDRYTKLLTDDGNFDFTNRVEWMIEDLLDLPFGAGAEIIRVGDKPDGDVVSIIPLDGGTLFPTLNEAWPVGQYIPNFNVMAPIYFPPWAINRVYMTPKPDIERAGWGMAPPEKIFLALEMLWRGDQYYANLLLDTPEAGILDLGDMDKKTAEDWVLSFRDLMSGIDPFKIPVLYEHTKPINYVKFGSPPTDIMFDKLSLKYAAFIAAGYGLTLGDIGIQQSSGGGGETLAGSIREERKTRRSGRAMVQRKLRNWHNRMLPPELMFNWIDQDEELNQGIARARLANATALGQLKDEGFITAEEGRLQLINDHLFTIMIPEKLPPEAQPTIQHDPNAPAPGGFGGGNQKPDVADQVDRPVAPSKGGHGDVKMSLAHDGLRKVLHPQFDSILKGLSDVRLRRMIRRTINALLPAMQQTVMQSTAEDLLVVNDWFEKIIDGRLEGSVDDYEDYAARSLSTVLSFLTRGGDGEDWWKVKPTEDEYKYMQSVYGYWFANSANGLMRRLTNYLYEHDYINSEQSPASIDVEATLIAMTLLNRAKTMVVEINGATQDILTRALLTSVRSELVTTGMADLLRGGVDIESIMSNNSFVNAVLRDVRNKLQQDFINRLDLIDEYEQGWAINRAVVDQLSDLGLNMKQWNHYGDDDPCERFCQPNINAGIVEMSYQYVTAFGPSTQAPGHGHCHCQIDFVPTEVQSKIAAGDFPLLDWKGEQQ
jgi:hypothetical protein